jgi:hypothetical protein
MLTIRRAASRSVVTPALVALLLAGCSSDTLTGADVAALTKSAKIDTGKPFKADCELNATITGFTATGFTQTVTGECQVSHLGRSSFYGLDVVDFATGTYEVNALITGANGDQVRATITGNATLTPTGAILAGSADITGGTGRFTDASGQTSQSAVVTSTGPMTATASYHLDGRLVY